MTHCPTDIQLSTYLAGGMEAGRRAEIGEHVDFCEDCRMLVLAARQAARDQRATPAQQAALDQGPSPASAPPRHEQLEHAAPAVGVVLGRYELVELIGAGGMGQVYRARDLELDRDVALKVLRPGMSGSAELLTARLLRESRLMARLSHPAVVSVYDVGRHGSLVYVAMELIAGTTLALWLRGPRSVNEVLSAFVAAGRGLIAAHQAGLVHRDFKPDNVLVSTDEDGRLHRVVVTDLGVARALTPAHRSPAPQPAGDADPATQLERRVPARSRAEASASGGGPRSSERSQDRASRSSQDRASRSSQDRAGPSSQDRPSRSSQNRAAASPSGVRVGGSGSGAALAFGSDAVDGLTVPGATVGTPAYMAPEQIEGRAVDQRADVFAFAASLWEALWASRPYPGRTLSEIAAAMGRPPQQGAPRGRIPRRVTQALVQALTIDVNERTATLEALLSELDPAIARKRKLMVLGAAAAALVTSSAAAALVLPARPVADPCAQDLQDVASLTSAAKMAELRRALGSGPKTDVVVKTLEDMSARWQATHRRACQLPAESLTAACLGARRTELAGIVEDLLTDSSLHPVAHHYVDYLGDPETCQKPASGMLLSRIPTDWAQRQPVRRLRARIIAAELLRMEGKSEEALTKLRDIRVAAEARWPAVYAEALYAEGGAEGKIGDSSRASETLKLAAAAAEKAHHDRVAAGAWTQLISSATFADNDVERALEYATYADAALDRIGRPPLDEMLLLYYHGAALAQAERTDDAEAKMRAALRLAEQHDPSKVPLIVQGLGFLYDAKGEYKKAVDMYREAIATSKEPRSSIAVFHAQLAMNLAMHGERELALVHANTAVTDATDGVDPRNDEWQTIKGARILVLRHLGRFEEALADIPAAQARASAARGRRSDDVALYEQLEAVLLADVGKISEAEPLIRRACETLAIAMGEGSIDHAGCLADQAAIELRAGHLAPAHAHAEHAIQIVEQVQNFHADVAVLYQVRGEVARRRGDRAKAAADFDRAIAMCPPYADPGYLASAHFAKARLFADSDPTAAKDLLQRAITAWQPDAGMWKRELGEAQALLATLSR